MEVKMILIIMGAGILGVAVAWLFWQPAMATEPTRRERYTTAINSAMDLGDYARASSLLREFSPDSSGDIEEYMVKRWIQVVQKKKKELSVLADQIKDLKDLEKMLK
jgi:hypothetical protein